MKMKNPFLKVIVFFVFLIMGSGCYRYAHISLYEDALKEIQLGERVLHLNFIIGKERKIAPVSMTVDANGNIYILDEKKQGLFQYSSSGSFKKRIELKTESAKVFSPKSVAINSNDNIILMDVHKRMRSKKRIHLISLTGDTLVTKELLYYYSDFSYCGSALFFSTYDPKRTKLIAKIPLSGSNSLEFGKMFNTQNPQLHYINNQVSICSDRSENVLLCYTFLPKVSIFSLDGIFIREFEFDDEIKNKKDSINIIPPIAPTKRVGNIGFADFGVEVHPICFDIAVQDQENIFLLTAVDHEKPHKRAIFRFDFLGNLLNKTILPFSCDKIYADTQGNLYFIGVAGGKYILTYQFL